VNKEVIDPLLTAMVQSGPGVSDLLFAVGKPPIVEEHGSLEEFPIDTPGGVLAPADIEAIGLHLMRGEGRLLEDLAKMGSCDCSYALADVARFRVNIFKQNGRQAIVMRKLATKIPTLDGLGLPPIFYEMVKEKNGIIFVTGSTGSGKTTTLAAMLNELNKTQQIHILTLEDPIEFLHPHQRALFNQRELGKDFPDFATGLRAALRQAPKVILVGEIRDRATMDIAMTASETGHIVFSTLHTINAGQTINRILGMYSKEEEQQLRQRLADTLRFVVSQRLVTKVGAGRLMVSEIHGLEPAHARDAPLRRAGEQHLPGDH
jgi:twitching motility protein PilT